MRLAHLGWDDTFAAAFERSATGLDVEPARVAIEFNHIYRIWTKDTELEATVAGRLKHHAAHRSELPAVGDWVVARRRTADDQAAIVAVLPRRSWFSRKMAGTITDEQIVAANVDVAFIAMALDADFSLRRLERYLLLARESGAAPVILLTKPDVSTTLAAQVTDVRSVARELPVHVVSPKSGQGIEHVAAYLTHGRTGALLGCEGRRLKGPPYDDAPGTRRATGRWADHRYPRHAGTAALGRGGGRPGNVRRHRGVGRRLSLHRLPAPRRAAMRREGRMR